ncbi:uncharacterized protein [Ptychodera flava]|uniref:uncharacterized protein n=1 Tax=Ptychodera flava TaxID=63121 RepID=UPI00396A7FFE
MASTEKFGQSECQDRSKLASFEGKESFWELRSRIRQQSGIKRGYLRTSLQSCKLSQNEEKLDALIAVYKNTKTKSTMLNGLLYIRVTPVVGGNSSGLGIKPDNARSFLEKTLLASQEYENALMAAGDILKLRDRETMTMLENKVETLNKQLERGKDLLPNYRKNDLLAEKDAVQERCEQLKSVSTLDNTDSRRKFNVRKRKLAMSLIDEQRIKKRKLGAGAKQRLDHDDEVFIAKAIEEKSSAHGRRHDTVLYHGHRVKKRDFLALANYSLSKRGKKLIKSANTVLLRSRPRNIRSQTAKRHLGSWLFCAKKPPKTEESVSVSTHYQRAHIKSIKHDMFSKNHGKCLVLSMDDKAYLRPGTDVGARNVKTMKVFDVTDVDKQKKLPLHDFSPSEVYQTPASFRFMTGHIDSVNGKEELMIDADQTAVIIRPKFYIGSSGSVLASDYIHLRWKLPQLFDDRHTHLSLPLHRFIISLHDIFFYFKDTTMMDDVACVTDDLECKFRNYESERLSWLAHQVERRMTTWFEEKGCLEEDDRNVIELENNARKVQEGALQLEKDIRSHTVSASDVWDKIGELLQIIHDVSDSMKHIGIPKCYGDILKATDAGPGVGISNTEVRYRDIEIVRIHGTERMNRCHRAPHDSGQNEAERSNAAIGEALVDGGALK